MFRRRKEKKTDYKARLALLKSKKKRIVVRKSNRYIKVQLVEYRENGDVTLSSYSSKNLKKLGWKGSLKNTPAAYLTGLAAGKQFQKEAKEGVLDIGMAETTKGGVLFAVLKGLVDSGLKIPHGKGNIPGEKRITGKVIADYGKGKNPSEVPKQFEKIKKKVKKDGKKE